MEADLFRNDLVDTIAVKAVFLLLVKDNEDYSRTVI
jgi:hypothetical protein